MNVLHHKEYKEHKGRTRLSWKRLRGRFVLRDLCALLRLPTLLRPPKRRRCEERALCPERYAARLGDGRSIPAFTLTEMLVVIGIIGLVAGLSLPFLVPMMRTRALDSAVDTVKWACIRARSMAIRERQPVNLTFLQYTDATHGPGVLLTPYCYAGVATSAALESSVPVQNGNNVTGYTYTYAITDTNQSTTVPTGYQMLLFSAGASAPFLSLTTQSDVQNTILAWITVASWNSSTAYGPGNMVTDGTNTYLCVVSNTNLAPSTNPSYWQVVPSPSAENIYMVMLPPTQPYCIHCLQNYGLDMDIRFKILRTLTQYGGQTVEQLPGGCTFTFPPALANPSDPSYTGKNAAWTYIFFPTGQVWTLPSDAGDSYTQYTSTPEGYTTINYSAWSQITRMANGVLAGPTIYAPKLKASSTFGLYATTGELAWRYTTYPPWNSSTTYYPGNTVADNGSAYICVATNTDLEPSLNPSYWQSVN